MRIKIDLPNLWDFVLDSQDLGESQNWQDKSNFTFLQGVSKISVPSCWNFSENPESDDLFGYCGVVWYFTEFRVPKLVEGTQNFLKFEGINNKAKVYIDGKLVHTHEGGYIPFAIDISKIEKEKDLFLAVKIDNRLSNETIPNRSFQKNYGGIIFDVYVIIRQKVYFEDYNLSARLIWDDKNKAKHAEVDFGIYIKNESDNDFKGRLEKKFIRNHVVVATDIHEVDCLKHNTRLSIKKMIVNNPLLWSPKSPEVYNVEISLIDESGFQYDRIETVWGFRELELVDKKFVLNKKEFSSIGINRQTDHPDFGSALPSNLTINDLSTIRRLGFNSMKFTGFPPEEFTLEMADRTGLASIMSMPLVIDDALIADKNAIRQITRCAKNYLNSMISMFKNHVSVIAWNIAIVKTKITADVVKILNELIGHIRDSIKSSKKITITASNVDDIPADLAVNFVCVDVGEINDKEEVGKIISDLAQKVGTSPKPFLITDIITYGKQMASADELDMESLINQSEIIGEVLNQFKLSTNFMGFFLGTFNDFYNDEEFKDVNFSGILDSYRNEKPSVSVIEPLLKPKK